MLKLSDEKLYELCVQFGEQARQARQKFLGLLPEVNRRRIYARKGFNSIFEFAYKLAGVSEKQVRNALNLNQKFAKLPVLRQQLVKGEVSLNKLIRVSSVVNSENEDFWAEQTKKLPQKALETLVRDSKFASLQEEQNQSSQLRAQLSIQEYLETVKLPADVAKQLNDLQARGIDVGQLLREFLDDRKEQINLKKAEISTNLKQTASRYIPQKVRNILYEEFGLKCSIQNCAKSSVHLHHTQRFAMSQTHDPHYIAPLCKEHHQIAHSIDYFTNRTTVST